MNSNEYAIKVQHIGKRYRIGVKEETHDSIGGTILNYITSPLRNYRKYRALYKFKDYELEKPDTGKNSDILWALKDISFEVKQGEVLGIIGKNGAGKSTLLKILCGITDPSKGYGEIHGRVSSLLEVGTGFHPDLTGRENVYLNATILGMKKAEVDRRYDEIVEFSGVEKFIDTPVKRYSSGMTVRLAFSVAAHLEPEILLIDEVLAVGDAEFQRKCLNKMENVGEKGRTVLFVSHNMSAITRLCKRTILIDNGVVIADGPSQEVVKSYLTSGSGSTALQEWHDPEKAPQGQIVRLLAVSVRGENGEITEVVDIRERFCIRMDYEVLKPGHRLMPFHHLYNDEGVEVFGAHDSDPAWKDRPRSAGRYKSIAWIPGNLMSEGTLFINSGMMTLSPDTRQFYETATVAFQVIEKDGGSPARGGWAGAMSGAVRPLLEWQTEIIS